MTEEEAGLSVVLLSPTPNTDCGCFNCVSECGCKGEEGRRGRKGGDTAALSFPSFHAELGAECREDKSTVYHVYSLDIRGIGGRQDVSAHEHKSMQTKELQCTLVSTHEGQMTCLPFFPFLVDFSLADPSTVHSNSTSNRASLLHAIMNPANKDNVISHHMKSHS